MFSEVIAGLCAANLYFLLRSQRNEEKKRRHRWMHEGVMESTSYARGDSYTSLMYTFRISKQSISEIVPEVCEAIITSLKQYVKMPKTSYQWKKIAHKFLNR
ncbi:hypothetical protein J437_LFUL015459 [Ladona fulva]|uniref:Uncharacterized protein n=1 Tax=Ladona fulva TaxID=123851 RepID=A0A8K0P2A9_LADFU|nr:hypothetical protein J437_LFUL015459 [Ladona fulva]